MSFFPEDQHPVAGNRRHLRSVVDALHRLTQLPASLSVMDRRRAHLLAWLLLVMILLTLIGLLLVLIVNPAGNPRRGEYVTLILVLLVLFSLAYGLNRTGHYQLSAVLTILCTVAGPWGSLVVDPAVRQGDFVPLTYVVISISLSSILLQPLFTGLLALSQLTALFLVARLSPAVPINWPSLLALIFFTSVLSILANLIGQQDLERIEQANRQLELHGAEQAVLVSTKIQLLAEAERRIKLLTVLHEVATVATQVDGIDRLIESITDIIGKSLFPDNCGVLLLDDETGSLHPHPSYHFTFDRHLFVQEVALGQGIAGRVAQTGRAIRLDSLVGIPDYREVAANISSALCVPVKLKDRVLGVINAESTHPGAFSEDDELLLGTVAGQLATAIERLRATAAEHLWLDQLAHSNELINALSRIAVHMQKASHQDEIMQILGDELSKLGVTCAMALCEPDQTSLVINYTSMSVEAQQRMEEKIGSPFVGYPVSLDLLSDTLKAEEFTRPSVMRSPGGQVQLFFAVKGETECSENHSLDEVDPKTTVFRLPLMFEETLLGIVWIWSTFLRDTDLPVMTTFAWQIANALKRTQLFQEVRDLALTDSLTGLQNRRSLFNLGRIELARSQRMDRPFGCLMLDLDHFKKINDTYGHAMGDRVVQEFARCCKESLRAIDLIGRYGGEEIVIFLPETDSATAMQIAERVREAVEKMPIQTPDRELHITVSIGASKRDENTLDLETLIARADQAMYIAKYKGRNRVAMST